MPTRPPIEQTFFNLTLVVGTQPTPMAGNLNLSSMVHAFAISNPSGNANSVFLGDANVSLTSGLEITVGSTPMFSIDQIRQLYEVQDPVLIAAQVALCQTMQPGMIPVIVWNPSNIYLIASLSTTVACMLFRNVYV